MIDKWEKQHYNGGFCGIELSLAIHRICFDFDFGIFYSDIKTEMDWTWDRHCPCKVLSTYYVLTDYKSRIKRQHNSSAFQELGQQLLLGVMGRTIYIRTWCWVPITQAPFRMMAHMSVDSQLIFIGESFSTSLFWFLAI